MFLAQELKDIPILGCLSAELRDRLAHTAADMSIEAGEWLIREGETASFFIVLSGRIDVLKEFNGQQKVVNEYRRGDFFGEVPILLGAPAFASLRAKEKCRVMRVDKMQLKEIIDDSPECSAIILQTMTKRLNMISEYIVENTAARVLVVGSQYDTDCRDIRSFLSMNRIPYEWVDKEREPERIPSCMTKSIDGPAVVIDRSICVGQNPTVRKVADALGIQTSPKRDGYDVVVIGAGPAGLAAAVYGSSEGLKTLLIERNAAGGQAGTSSRIENYLGFPGGISGEELTSRALKQAEKFETEIVMTREVKNIAAISNNGAPGYCVELDGGERVSTRSVIVATGVEWRRLEADGVDRLIGRGVLYGAAKTESMTVVGKDVVIVGGGNSAGQAAMYFSSYAKSVAVIVRGAGLQLSMSQYLVTQIEGRPNITVEPFTQVVSVGGESHLETICTQTGNDATGNAALKTRKADALFVMIGADANTKWLPGNLQRDERGYICTGRDVTDLPGWNSTQRAPFLLETNLPGFFCAGDVRHDSIKRVSSGVGEGSMAIAFVHQYFAQQDAAAARTN